MIPTPPSATPGPNEVVSDETIHFDYPGSDIVLRSYDPHDFRVHKLYIVICSPVLRELIQSVSNISDLPHGEKQEPLPVVKLPESKATLYSLLTFIFPVAPILPSTTEKIMELLAVAQKYQMNSVMTHIRGAISRQDPPFLRPETALHIYFLAQQHDLRQEAVQAARVTLRLSMTIEDLGDKLEVPGMTGAYLHELWKYHQQEGPTSANSDPPSVPSCFDIPDANIVVRSSDQVNFPVHKSVLAMSSPFFKDLLSLPQPPDDELVDGLPVIQLSEDAGLLNSLISLLYPISPAIPDSYEKVFALLAACQKYDMESVQSNIRAGIKLGTFPAPVEAEAFRACVIAGSMGLAPELENAARLTLGLPMTFESLGEQLRSFKGRALCDLVRYREPGNKV
ncbi:hypothetical protein EDB85DRAFT_2096539 [Lactarius pseudohatsudake]|nr:hypothetical protein EDB85DRAFT_2096539 [Lactarius pseudohatsudake]